MNLAAFREAFTAPFSIVCTVLVLFGFSFEASARQDGEPPNILLIVADDLGYTDLGVYGGEISTPNLDSLAKSSRMLTDYHASPACSPTRAMLLTGSDSHLTGLGAMQGTATPNQAGQPGYETYVVREYKGQRVLTIATLLKEAGYHTYMAGKWDTAKPGDPATGPKARGFEESFALMAGGASHFADRRGWIAFADPAVYLENGIPAGTGPAQPLPAEFYSSSHYTDKMIGYIDKHQADGRPFFSYLAYTAPHWPLQAPDDWLDRYTGRYDRGWDVLREERVERMKQMGLLPRDFITPTFVNNKAPAWDDLSDEIKTVEIRKMEIYAAMVENLDFHIGRLLDHLKKIGEYDNTIIVFMSDNGAAAEDPAEWLPTIALPLQYWYAGSDSQIKAAEKFFKMKLGVGSPFDHSYQNMGRPNSYVALDTGWAKAAGGPQKLFKMNTSAGGIRVPAFIKYPGDLSEGAVDSTFMTVMDLAPTFLDVAGAQRPEKYEGQPVLPMRGESIIPYLTGQQKMVHDDDYVMGWELFRNVAIRKGDWKLVSNDSGSFGDSSWRPSAAGDEAYAFVWQLYNVAEDPYETNDVSSSQSEKLEEMIGAYEQYASEVGIIWASEEMKGPHAGTHDWLNQNPLPDVPAPPAPGPLSFPRPYYD